MNIIHGFLGPALTRDQRLHRVMGHIASDELGHC